MSVVVIRLLAPDEPEAHVGDTAVGVALFSVGDVQVASFAIHDVAAADHSLGAGTGAAGVDKLLDGAGVRGVVPIPAPFRDVAAHVVETVGVGVFAARGAESAGAVVSKPGYFAGIV